MPLRARRSSGVYAASSSTPATPSCTSFAPAPALPPPCEAGSELVRGIHPVEVEGLSAAAAYRPRKTIFIRLLLDIATASLVSFVSASSLFERFALFETLFRTLSYAIVPFLLLRGMLELLNLCILPGAPELDRLSSQQRRLLGLPPMQRSSTSFAASTESITPTATPSRPRPLRVRASPSSYISPSRWSTASPSSTASPRSATAAVESPRSRLLDANRITDKESLERFLRERAQRSARQQDQSLTSPTPSHSRFVYASPQYAEAVRDVSTSDSVSDDVDTGSQVSLRETALNEMASPGRGRAHEQQAIELHAERFRFFICSDIVKPLSEALKRSDEELVQARAQLLQARRPPGDRLAEATTAEQIAAALKASAEAPYLVETRRQLLEYVSVARPTDPTSSFPANYVTQRVHTLSSSAYMSEFSWESGGSWLGKPWTAADLPTDTQLLLHFFLKYMDARVMPRGSFSSVYFRAFAESRSSKATTAPVLVQQVRVNPPYFVLLVKESRDVKPRRVHPMPGRHCLFLVFALFVDYLHRDYDGLVCHRPLQSLGTSRTARLALGPTQYQ